MERAQVNLVVILLLAVGVSLTVIGCGDGDSNSPTDPVTPTPTPEPTPKTLLETTVSLSENSTCESQGVNDTFCYETTFLAESGAVVTVTATGASNMGIVVDVYDSANTWVAGDSGYGAVSFTFTPRKTDLYRLQVDEYFEVGGAVHIIATQ